MDPSLPALRAADQDRPPRLAPPADLRRATAAARSAHRLGQGRPLKIVYWKALRERTDPFELSALIDAKLRRIWATASRRPATPLSSNALELTTEEKQAIKKISKIFGVRKVKRRRKDKPMA